MEYLYPIVLLSSIVMGLVFVRFLKGKMLSFGIRGTDINKADKPKIPEAGGMLLLPGIWILVIALIESRMINPLAYVFLFTITCFAAVGFFDDGFRLFKKEEGWHRYVINRGLVLFLFTLAFGYLVAPLVIVGCTPCLLYWVMVGIGLLILMTSSFANSFAGINGWEVGSSLIVICGLTIMVGFSPIYTSTLVTLGLIMVGATMALLYFNSYPASIFPGDSGTLLLGSFMGCMLVFIDHWYIALGLFLPHLIDIFLKFKTNSGDMSQKDEKPYALKDGKLEVPNSGKLDYAKCLIRTVGPVNENRLSKIIVLSVLANTTVWTGIYLIIKLT
jgi:UDP-N-acetylglucosamine--dolichyl-phosphate N-acetylglucosaminephosphotransferase